MMVALSSGNSPRRSRERSRLMIQIDVAGTVLRRSECADDETLIEGAKTKGQEHLFVYPSALASRDSPRFLLTLFETASETVLLKFETTDEINRLLLEN